MYREDVAKIAEYSQSAAGLADTIIFALLSVRMHFMTMRTQMADVRRIGANSHYLWGMKRQGYDDLMRIPGGVHRLRDGLDTLGLGDDRTLGALHLIYNSVTGLGMVKSGFVAQMLGYDVGCIDSRNMEALGLDQGDAKRLWRLDDVREGTRIRRMERYIAFCRKSGGPETLWNNWCNGIGPSMGLTGEEVSRLHSKIITRR